MIRSKHASRAVALLHYIQILPLILPIPLLQNMCLSNIDSVLAVQAPITSNDNNENNMTINDIDNTDKTKKKKKKNNEIEVYPENTPEECSFITQSMNDMHPYGASAVLLQFLLEKSSREIDTIVAMTEIKGEIIKKTEINDENDDVSHIIKLSNFMKLKTPFLRQFLKDLQISQNDETGKVLRLVCTYVYAFLLL